MTIDWQSTTSHLLCNPTYSPSQQEKFQQIIAYSSFSGHIWLATSGSTQLKWVGLSKQALLTSAQAVNLHLKSDRNDWWIHCLPDFHVGGLSIWARAFLSHAKVCDFKAEVSQKWQATLFYDYIQEKKGTLTALVATQLYDLVSLPFEAPAYLRAVIIGGGALSDELYFKARAKKWPILPSYGLTECSSQVATASLDSLQMKVKPHLQLLSHIQAKQEQGRLCLLSDSLLSSYAMQIEDKIEFFDPKVEGWFLTEDRAEINQNRLSIEGRVDHIVKIGGENVDMAKLNNKLQNIKCQINFPHEVILLAMPDERLDHALHLAIEAKEKVDTQNLLQVFHAQVLPFEKIRNIHFLASFPRSALHKVLITPLTQSVLEKGD